jgi:hypothetical protein
MKWRPGTDSGSAVLSFADTFHRADQPFMLGDSWVCAPTEVSTIVGGSNLAASINIGGGVQANFSICSSNGNNFIICYPVPISWNIVFTQPQYAQCRIVADNSGGANFAFMGPAVLFNINKNTGYSIETNVIFGVGNQVLRYTVASTNGGGAQSAINNNGGAGFTFAIGDVLRIEAIPNSPAANQTTVKTYRNGVLQSSDVDAVNHYTSGVCGFGDLFCSAGVTQSWDNFQGGVIGH